MLPHMIASGLAVAPPVLAMNAADNWWLYLIGSTGFVGLVTLVVTTVRDVMKNRMTGREVREADMKLQRDTAWRERNAERRERLKEEARGNAKERNVRRVLDYAAKLRRQLLDNGLQPAAPEPDLEDPETSSDSFMREH